MGALCRMWKNLLKMASPRVRRRQRMKAKRRLMKKARGMRRKLITLQRNRGKSQRRNLRKVSRSGEHVSCFGESICDAIFSSISSTASPLKHIIHSEPQKVEDTFFMAMTYMSDPKETSVARIKKYILDHYKNDISIDK